MKVCISLITVLTFLFISSCTAVIEVPPEFEPPRLENDESEFPYSPAMISAVGSRSISSPTDKDPSFLASWSTTLSVTSSNG